MSKAYRTVRVPVERPSEDVWSRLTDLAGAQARFANKALALQYAALSARMPKDMMKAVNAAVYGEDATTLSGWARNASLRRIKGYWKRKGKLVLAGYERLACFSASASLTLQCDEHNQGALFEREGDSFLIRCRFEPVYVEDDSGRRVGKRDPITLTVGLDSPGARKDWHIREAVEALWSGAWGPGTLTLRLDRRRRKVDALISYSRPATPRVVAGNGATLGPYEPESGQVWLRFDDVAPPLEYSHYVRRMIEMSEHYAGIRKRLSNQRGRGPRRLQVYRRKLAATPTFAGWADDFVHRWSREIVTALAARGVKELRIGNLGVGDLPWHALRQRLAYKCEDAGIAVVDAAAEQDATYRAVKADVAKRTRRISRARKGVSATKELLCVSSP